MKIKTILYEPNTKEEKIIERDATSEEANFLLTNWFKTDYTTYVQMFTRREALGKTDVIEDEFRNKTYHNLIELYEEAELVASEIRGLRK